MSSKHKTTADKGVSYKKLNTHTSGIRPEDQNHEDYLPEMAINETLPINSSDESEEDGDNKLNKSHDSKNGMF